MRLYVFLVILYGFTFLPWFSLYRTAETLLVIVFIWVAFFHPQTKPYRRSILEDPIFLLSSCLLFVLSISQAWYWYSLPDQIEPSIKITRHFLKPVLVLILAFGVALAPRRTSWWLLLAATLGLITYLVMHSDITHWYDAWSGKRIDFGILNAQHTAMIFGTLLIGLISFGPRLFMLIRELHWSLATLALTVLIGATLFGVLAAQSRATWLGMGAAALVGLGVAALVFKRNNSHASPRGRAWILSFALIGGVVVVGLIAFDADDRIAKRIASEDISMAELAEASALSSTPTSSSTIRVASWAAAMQWFQERPLLGWGAGTTKQLIQRSEFFSERFKQRFGHLHNSFIESLVANGLIGTMLLMAMAIWIGIATVQGFVRGYVPGDVFIFAWSFFCFWFVVNLFESYILYPTGQYINAVVVGFIYSFHLKPTLKGSNCG